MSWHDELREKQHAAERLERSAPDIDCRQNPQFSDDSDSCVDTPRTPETQWQPFPVDALPEPVRGFVVVGAKSIGCDPSYVALPLLSVLASALNNSCRLRLKHGWLVPPILWTVSVGESGSAKSPAWALAMQPVREIERELEHEYGGRSDNNHSAPEERWTVTDTTVEALAPLLVDNPRGLLLSRDELSGWLASFDQYRKGRTSSDAAHWLSMYHGQPLRIDRKTGEPRTLSVASAAVCICGTIQPGVLHRAIGNEHRENGLLARLLPVWPSRQVKRWTDAGISPEHVTAVRAVLERLWQFEPTLDRHGEPVPVILTLNDDAMQLYREFYDANARILANATGDYAAAVSKLEELPARLSLILHLTRWASDGHVDTSTVDAESMAAAITLTSWFRNETQRVYSKLAASAEDCRLHELVDWIKTRGGRCTVRDLQRGNRDYGESSDVAERALQNLADRGFGRWQSVRPGTAGGSPTRVFVLNC